MKKKFNKIAIACTAYLLPYLTASAQQMDTKAKSIMDNTQSGLITMGDSVLTIVLIILLIIGAIVIIPQVLKLGSDRGEDAQKGLSSSAIWLLIGIGVVGILKMVMTSVK